MLYYFLVWYVIGATSFLIGEYYFEDCVTVRSVLQAFTWAGTAGIITTAILLVAIWDHKKHKMSKRAKEILDKKLF